MGEWVTSPESLILAGPLGTGKTHLAIGLTDVVQTIKRNPKVDWTEPQRDQVCAEIGAAVKRVLRKRGVQEADFHPFNARFVQPAEAQYAEWPVIA